MRNEERDNSVNPQSTIQNPKSPYIPHSSVTRRELGWTILGWAAAAALFLSPALVSGRFLSPADLLYSYYPWHGEQPAGWAGPSNALLNDSVLQFEPWLAYSAARLHAGALP